MSFYNNQQLIQSVFPQNNEIKTEKISFEDNFVENFKKFFAETVNNKGPFI